MKHFLLLFPLFLFSVSAYPQKEVSAFSISSIQKETRRDVVNISIYPVPVRENSFTIISDKEISAIKITNIIGQDIYRVQYSDPQFISKIILNNPKKGIYLVAILFRDQTMLVKKIMIEGIN